MLSYKEEMLMLGLEKMFRGNRFDICTVRELAVILGNGGIPKQMEAEFSILHCVGYADIPKGIRDGLPRRVIEALSYSTPPGVELDIDGILRELLRRLRDGYQKPESFELPSPVQEEVVREKTFSFRTFFRVGG